MRRLPMSRPPALHSNNDSCYTRTWSADHVSPPGGRTENSPAAPALGSIPPNHPRPGWSRRNRLLLNRSSVISRPQFVADNSGKRHTFPSRDHSPSGCAVASSHCGVLPPTAAIVAHIITEGPPNRIQSVKEVETLSTPKLPGLPAFVEASCTLPFLETLCCA